MTVPSQGAGATDMPTGTVPAWARRSQIRVTTTTMPRSSRHHSSIEPLEARIAPALLVNGANLLGGAGNPSIGETSIGDTSVELVEVTSGQAIVWFLDGEINAISFGQNTTLEINGNVLGDLIGNLHTNGRLSDSDNNPANGEDGGVLLPNNLLGVKMSPLSDQTGDVVNIVTGGSISNVSISGNISGMYAGDGVFHADSRLNVAGSVERSINSDDRPTKLDVNPVSPGVQETFIFTRASSIVQSGASVKQATIEAAKELQLFAGSGDADGVVSTGAGAAGGSVENITIVSAFTDQGASSDIKFSYSMRAGDGESGRTGGAGGSVLNVIENASSGSVLIAAGDGGEGSAGRGGAGGSVRGLDMQSDSSNYTVTSGDGGRGVGGGAGGTVGTVNFTNRTPTNSLLITADFTNDDIEDVLVIDSSTAQMVISRSIDNGANFEKVVQTIDEDGNEVVTIAGLGTTPVDALAVDFDGDDDLDIVVAYKNSNNLGVFLNNSTGKFFDEENNVVSGFSSALGFSPAILALEKNDGASLAVTSNDAGKTIVHQVIAGADSYSVGSQITELPRVVTDLVSTGDGRHLFASTQDGSILKLSRLDDPTLPLHNVLDTNQKIAGSIANLDVDSTGSQLLALSLGKKAMALFNIGDGGALTAVPAPDLSLQSGRALVARFVDTTVSNIDSIAVLSSLTAGSRIDLFDVPADDGDPTTVEPSFVVSKSLISEAPLKNFAVAEGTEEPGVAAVGGSLSQFYFSRTLDEVIEYSLPFVGKAVDVVGGRGGDAFDSGKVFGKAGAGGSVVGVNAESIEITLRAGDGGNSANGAAGAGGSVSNPATFVSANGTSVSPRLVAETTLEITVGKGGSAVGGAGSKLASGGAGGSISGLALSLAKGEVKLLTGAGGDGNGGNGGNGGAISGLSVTALSGSLSVDTGTGGSALSGKMRAGAGGSISNFKHALELSPEQEAEETSYFVSINTGRGGNAPQGFAGAGGSLSGVTLTLDGADRTFNAPLKDPPLVDAQLDSTVSVTVETGDGGNGAVGGAGGAVSNFSSVSVFDQQTEDGQVRVNYVTMTLVSGSGGSGSGGAGGSGGSISFAPAGVAGITGYDPDAELPADNPDGVGLRVVAGFGGAGSTIGGAGGSISNLTAKNAKFVSGGVITNTHLGAAIIAAGQGGTGATLDGGRGGEVSQLSLAVEAGKFESGLAAITSGAGGAGGSAGKGGAGGAIRDSYLATVNGAFLISSGAGGAGAKGGGAGGLVASIEINVPQVTSGEAAIILGGDGGAATDGGAIGGAGGDISKITNRKDVNSAIDLIQAGNGGASAGGSGGRGGNVSSIQTVGFLGKPSSASGGYGAFDDLGLSQGVFSGHGGDGATSDGAAGSISAVSARQIAAIAAAVGAGGMFAPASKISKITADVIGYDSDGDGVFDNVTGSTDAPDQTQPIDGFVFATFIDPKVANIKFKFLA